MLYQLRTQKDRFDDYIATFKHYAKQAEFNLTHLATIQLFAIGIETNSRMPYSIKIPSRIP